MEKSNRCVRWLALAMLVLMSMAMTMPAFAYPSHTDFISDSATVIDEVTENSVKKLSEALLEEKNVRIALCTVLNTGSESTADYAASIYEEWGVGHGVLLLIVTEADTFYAVQSNSVSDVLTSDKLSDIINTTMEPRFAEKDYAGGAIAAANALSDFMKENLPDDIGEKKGGLPGWLSVILKIILVLAIIIIAGYGLLVYFERKKAEERRLAMEMRRRRLAEEGRAYRSSPKQGYGRQNTQRSPQGYNGQNRPQRSRQGYPQQGYPQQRYPQRPAGVRQNVRSDGGMRSSMEQTGQYIPQTNRRNIPQRYDDNAATVQISTADIRAVKGGRDKFSTSSHGSDSRS